MPKSPKTYRKLPGSGSMAFQWVRLFVGPDHLLQVTSNGFTESYQRFFFADIQVISIRRNVLWLVWSAVWTAIAVLCLTIALAAGDDVLLPLSIVAGVWLGLLAFNLYLGPSCTCVLQTAVQTQRLPSLKRVRRVRKVLLQLAPLIAEAQGTVDAETLLLRLDPFAAARTGAGSTTGFRSAGNTSGSVVINEPAMAPGSPAATALPGDSVPTGVAPGPEPAPAPAAPPSGPGKPGSAGPTSPSPGASPG